MNNKGLLLLVLSMFVIIFMSGCSWFSSSRQLNMAPFSENAGTMFGEAAKISRPFQWKHMQKYTNIPEFKKLSADAIPVLQVLRGIVYYSNQVVAINNSRLKDTEKNRQLAQYLSEVMQKAIDEGRYEELGQDMNSLKQVINEDIPKAKTYLDGIAAASPIINGVVLSTQDRLDKIQNDVGEILVIFDRLVVQEFADTRINYESLKALQSRSMRAMTMIYDALMGRPATRDSLLMLDISLGKFFPQTGTPSLAQLTAAEDYLLERLNRIDKMIDQLKDDIREYHAKRDEMQAWRIGADEKIKIARNAMTVWAQSHRNLGAGIPVPPMIDVAGIAGGLVGKATKTVLP